MWNTVPLVTTGLIAIAFLIAAGVTAYWINQYFRYKGVNKEDDPASRLQMLRDLDGSFVPDLAKLTREQTAEVVNSQIRNKLTLSKHKLWAWVIVCALLIVAIVVIALWSGQPAKPDAPKDGNGQKEPLKTDDRDLPLARIDNFGGHALKHVEGDRFMSATTYQVMDRKPVEPDVAYPVIAFELSKVARHDRIKVNSVSVVCQPVQRKLVRITGTNMSNFKPPIIYSAKLSPKKKRVEARLTINGSLTDGLILFTEEDPTAKFRIEFEGVAGLYLVNVELEVQEVRGGEKMTLKSDHPVFIVPPKDGDS